MLEKHFQRGLIKEIKKEFPDAIVMKADANYIQGIPDLLILHKKRWAALEVKNSPSAKHQPNQDYYISKMNKMSYAAFVDPTNKAGVMNELRKTFGSRRNSCLSRSK